MSDNEIKDKTNDSAADQAPPAAPANETVPEKAEEASKEAVTPTEPVSSPPKSDGETPAAPPREGQAPAPDSRPYQRPVDRSGPPRPRPRFDRSGPPRDNRQRSSRYRVYFRKKVCKFCLKRDTIDYLNPEALSRFVTIRGKILPSRITGNCAKHQRQLAQAIKRARVLALLPFARR